MNMNDVTGVPPGTAAAAGSSRARRLAVALVLALGALAAALPARAQPASEDVGPRFDVVAYRVEGNSLLDPATIEAALAPHAGPHRSFADVQAAVAALRAAYALDGYAGVQVGVPEQQLASGTVRLQVVEPRLGTVRIEGQRHGDGASVRHALPSLQEGSTPNTRRLARELRLANENPARRLAVDLQSVDPERLDAVVTVQDEKPWKIGLVLDNRGTPETGRARLGAFFQHADVAGLGHVATLQYVTSPDHISEVTIAALNYRAPLPALGDALDFYAVHADIDSGTVNALFDVRGRGDVAGLRYTLNLPGAGEFRHRWVFGFERRHVDNRVGLTGGTPNLVPDVTLRPASVGYAASWRDELRVVDGSLAFYRNLPSGRDGNAAAIEAARSGARAGYAIWRYAASAVHTLPADWRLKLALEGQHTRDALVSGEQFGLGGQDSVRGFQERELTGDRGQRVTLELQTPDVGGRIQPGLSAHGLVFLDQGSVLRNHTLAGEIRRSNVASVGAGVRLALDPSWHLSLDVAQVLQGGGVRPRGSRRLHVSIGWAN